MKNRNKLPLALFFSLSLFSCQQSEKQQVASSTSIDTANTEEQVRQVLNEQASCWSKGDLECYMDGYWKSDSLLFIGKSGLTYGWQQTLDNYKRSYPNTDAMGKLTFDLKEVKPLSGETMLVVGKWHLARNIAEGDLQGHFSVIFRKFTNGWKIIADHSS
ncbi:YybH family protein [Pontibacter harenae]|uniref:YybH family protein n=1 Tax=Pontibacter harenae TaxID=2894083 RepID=UPI001E40956F|nr:DUF4440 domain-containing protein [Pontibacter harenae]MCC9167630.1 nuclear transport factor 2 family protein [Pontibacter harenae]